MQKPDRFAVLWWVLQWSAHESGKSWHKPEMQPVSPSVSNLKSLMRHDNGLERFLLSSIVPSKKSQEMMFYRLVELTAANGCSCQASGSGWAKHSETLFLNVPYIARGEHEGHRPCSFGRCKCRCLIAW